MPSLVGARLAGEGGLADAFAGKPGSYRGAFAGKPGSYTKGMLSTTSRSYPVKPAYFNGGPR